MILKRLEVGSFASNCYILGDKEAKEGVIIDPGGEGKRILQEVDNLGLNIKYIINTHGHIDHVAANEEVMKVTGAPLLIHREDGEMCREPHASLAGFMGIDELPAPDKLLEEGDKIQFGALEMEVISTPGHTRGGICLKMPNLIFTGDTLFAGSIGRTDLPGGDYEQIIKSIKEKLIIYPDDTVVYPGHGPASNIGDEKKMNPFLK